MQRCVAVVSSFALAALLAAPAAAQTPPPSDPATTQAPSAMMKAKEKPNRTKCSSNLRAMGPEGCTDADQPAGDPQELKVKEKGARTKCGSNLRQIGGFCVPSDPADALKVKEKGARTKCSSNLRTTEGSDGGAGRPAGDKKDPDVCADVQKSKHDAAMPAIQNTR
jgi:hypothetical protein